MDSHLQDYLISLFNNPYINVITFVFGLVGILLSIYFFIKGKRNKKPTYMIRTINLVKQNIRKIETVQITYNKEPIENLSISKFAIWNDGKDTINSTDIAQNNQLKIEIDNEFQILDAEIIYEKNGANDFTIQISENYKKILLYFDYFDFEEGIVLQVYHTGNSNENLSFTGTVKSVKKIIEKNSTSSVLTLIDPLRLLSNKKEIKKKTVVKIVGWSLIVFFVVFCFIITYTNEEQSSILKKISVTKRFFLSVLISSPYFYIGFKILRRRIPKGFDIFEDEF